MNNALKAVGMQYEKPTVIKVYKSDIVSISADSGIDSSRFTPDDYSFFNTGTKRTR